MRFLVLAGLLALAEMATFLWVGSSIGFGWALGIALMTALLGSFLVRRAGLSVLVQIRDKFDRGQIPARELVDGAAILVAGAFLISPGFITDTLGFLLLIPAVRSLLYRPITKRFTSRVAVFSRGTPAVTGEIIDIDEVE
jgi:UPF0716 protein FxsA